MKADLLINLLNKDFILTQCSDDWGEIDYNSYYTNSFMTSYMGLALDNTKQINQVYTAVFASATVIDCLINNSVTEALLFTHHPMEWNITSNPIFQELSLHHLQELKERKISLYNLHVPLDRNSDFSTSVNLAKAMGANILEGFYDYHGCKIAVIAQAREKTVSELKHNLEKVIGHNSKLYSYGYENIDNGLVAFCGGGGNQPELYEFMASKKVNTYITGVTSADTGYPPAIVAHENAKKHKINIIGGTHYSTEKFACIKMIEYFNRYNLSCKFIEDVPCFEDM